MQAVMFLVNPPVQFLASQLVGAKSLANPLVVQTFAAKLPFAELKSFLAASQRRVVFWPSFSADLANPAVTALATPAAMRSAAVTAHPLLLLLQKQKLRRPCHQHQLSIRRQALAQSVASFRPATESLANYGELNLGL